MTYAQARVLLADHGQERLLAALQALAPAARKRLLAQIAALDFAALDRMRDQLARRDAAAAKKGAPRAPKVSVLSGAAREKARAAGLELLAAGKVGVLLVAGGQGSRLGYDGPKGCYAIGPQSGQSLFYYHARKIRALEIAVGKRIPFYVMTSDANDAATRKHFADNDFFELDPKCVTFFRQGTWPALDDDGQVMLDAPDHVFKSPDGHGGMLSALAANGCFADMRKRGVTTLFYFQVDNPLVEVADPVFLGFHARAEADYSLKLCAKRDPNEGLGMPVVRGGKWAMIEYTEMTEEMNNRRTASGDLYFKYGSPAIHVFDRAFLEAEAAKALPLHLAHKKIPFADAAGKIVKPEKPNGWKFEKFIFDCLGDAKKVACLAFDRADEFSPVKNAEGADSPATCRADLQAKWRRALVAAGVTLAPETVVDLDPVVERLIRTCGLPYFSLHAVK